MRRSDEDNGLVLAAAALAISTAANAAAISGIERAAAFYHERLVAIEARRVLERAREDLPFQFIEAPPKTRPQKPSPQAPRMSDRDALDQDLERDKSKAEGPPKTVLEAASDQLAQTPARPGSAPAPPAVEAPAVKLHEAAAETTPAAEKIPPAGPPREERAPDPLGETAKPVVEAVPEPRREVPPVPEEKRAAASQPSPSQEPRPPDPGLTGRDKIITQEMGRLKSAGASLYGMTSFEATGSGMGEYMKNLKEKVWFQWFPYLSFQYPSDFKSASVRVRFTLDKEGQVKIIRVAESHGSEVFASFCVESIQRASPFGPLPPELLALLGKDEVEITFGFHYQ